MGFGAKQKFEVQMKSILTYSVCAGTILLHVLVVIIACRNWDLYRQSSKWQQTGDGSRRYQIFSLSPRYQMSYFDLKTYPTSTS